jgi:hypothetical protein
MASNSAKLEPKMVECEGVWFAHCDQHVLWSYDKEELLDLLTRWPVEVGTGYYELHHPLTGVTILAPDAEEMTERQQDLVLGMVKESMRRCTLQ